ncbi:DUF2785 domain-containing protein [Agromyces soli]
MLRTLIERDVIEGGVRRRLGDVMAERFTHPDVQARTFAPLVLDMIVRRGDVQASWVDAFAAWFPGETDLRGHDSELGWLHAVAHGADLLGSLGVHPSIRPEHMLGLAAERLVVPTEFVWREREEERLADAVVATLARPELTGEERVAWIEKVGAALRAVPRGTTPAFASNALRTLYAVYLRLDAGLPPAGSEERAPVPDADRIKRAVLQAIEVDAAKVG